MRPITTCPITCQFLGWEMPLHSMSVVLRCDQSLCTWLSSWYWHDKRHYIVEYGSGFGIRCTNAYWSCFPCRGMRWATTYLNTFLFLGWVKPLHAYVYSCSWDEMSHYMLQHVHHCRMRWAITYLSMFIFVGWDEPLHTSIFSYL